MGNVAILVIKMLTNVAILVIKMLTNVAILGIKMLTGIASDVNLRFLSHAGNNASKEIHLGFETQGKTHPVQNRGISAPQERLDVPQI